MNDNRKFIRIFWSYAMIVIFLFEKKLFYFFDLFSILQFTIGFVL